MAFTDGSSVKIIHFRDVRPSTAAEDNGAHRKGPPPLSYELQSLTANRARAVLINVPSHGLEKTRHPSGPVAPARNLLQGTGWHYHLCSLQLAFITGGSIAIAFNDETWSCFYGGEILVIPHGAPHNAKESTADYGLVELTFPGDFGTESCPPLPLGTESKGTVLDDAKVTAGGANGVAQYALAPHLARVASIWLLTAGRETAAAPPEPGLRVTLVTNGECHAESGGKRERISAFDLMIEEGDSARTRLASRSDDFRAYRVQLHG